MDIHRYGQTCRKAPRKSIKMIWRPYEFKKPEAPKAYNTTELLTPKGRFVNIIRTSSCQNHLTSFIDLTLLPTPPPTSSSPRPTRPDSPETVKKLIKSCIEPDMIPDPELTAMYLEDFALDSEEKFYINLSRFPNISDIVKNDHPNNQSKFSKKMLKSDDNCTCREEKKQKQAAIYALKLAHLCVSSLNL